jgi:hypothetical protein
MKVNHILTHDWGTHLVTACGKFPLTVEEAMGGFGVCKPCKKAFLRTPEAIQKERDELETIGKRFLAQHLASTDK